MASMENGKKENPSYYSVIPAEVRYCAALGKPTARDLYGEIAALCNKHGYCFASNGYLANLYGIESRSVQRYLVLLEKNGFIYIKLGKQRRIYLVHAMAKFDANGMQEPAEAPEVPHETPPEPPKEKKAKATDGDLMLAEMLLSKILYNFPSFENKKVKVADWAEEIRKLREIDKATVQQIEFMITWVQGGQVKPTNPAHPMRSFEPHEFWAKNILSATKLRKQWFTLVPQLQSALKKEVKKHVAADLRTPGKAPVGSAHRSAKL